MARKRTRKRFRSRTKWAANIQELNENQITVSPGTWSATSTLATNPTQNTLGVSQIFTCKNFYIDFTIESPSSYHMEAITAYIMYVPQGMIVGNNYNLEHPEYIMNYKYLGSPQGGDANTVSSELQNFQPFRVRTRLSRKLNTGDSIVLFLKGFSTLSVEGTLKLSGLIRWWTKAN